ncbi:MAG TPA: biotin--[acetyl-CoA-carboxylase] ligase [Bacteroidia bacterium]|nr:biotin--[acetyl-CoA-carboxylase] ligase [Bacteroidia bacterium]
MDTLFIGQHILELDETESTNTYATNLIKEIQVAEGAIVLTHKQTKGRGQVGNTWQAESGKNLTFSLILHPTFLAVDKQFYLSKITSLAVFGMLTDFLNTSLYDIKVKWPNDILVNDRKIAGILIENILRGNFLQSSVIGVGININQRSFSNVEKQATSLGILLQKDFDLKEMLHVFCKHFEALYLSLKHNNFDKISETYFKQLYKFNEWAIYQAKEQTFKAKITKVEESGLLVLTTEQNDLLKFNFKEVQLIA